MRFAEGGSSRTETSRQLFRTLMVRAISPLTEGSELLTMIDTFHSLTREHRPNWQRLNSKRLFDDVLLGLVAPKRWICLCLRVSNEMCGRKKRRFFNRGNVEYCLERISQLDGCTTCSVVKQTAVHIIF